MVFILENNSKKESYEKSHFVWDCYMCAFAFAIC